MSATSKAFADGLLHAQQMANAASNLAMREGRTEAANALAALSTDLLLEREQTEAYQQSLTERSKT